LLTVVCRTRTQHPAEEKIADIDGRIAHLRAMRGALAELVDRCHSRADALSCPFVETLSEGATRS